MATFDATVPVELQLNDYSCSVGATYWCLRSIGVSLTQQDLEAAMVPGLVSQQDGLLDGTGTGIVGLLRRQFGLTASNTSPVNFDDVVGRAGTQPIAIGGHRWYVDADGNVTGHWVAVRGFDGSQLLLANPGGSGPHFGQQTLDRAAWDQRAPFAAVWIAAGATVPASPVGVSLRVANTDGMGVRVRGEPATSAAVVCSLADGELVTGESHAWRAVTDADGTAGWLANEFLAAADSGAFVVANTGGTGANLRPGPSTDGTSIRLEAEGTRLTGADHAWRKVSDQSGNNGWIADEFLVSAS
jgi:SH3-like domain-containing protein